MYRTNEQQTLLGYTSEEKQKMATIKEQALVYETKQTKNISELEQVPVNMELTTNEYTKTDGEVFTVNTICVGEQTYRVPNSVLKQLHELLAEKPDMRFFKVRVSGQGMQTSYTVIPLE